jgi:hypothetical protein
MPSVDPAAPVPPPSNRSSRGIPVADHAALRLATAASDHGAPSTSRGGASAEDGFPLPYLVVSAFFLAIAVVGFGVWLAFGVFSL